MVLVAVSTSWLRLFKTKLLAASVMDSGVVMTEAGAVGQGGTQVGQFGHPPKSKTSKTSIINPLHVEFPGGQGVGVVVFVVISVVVISAVVIFGWVTVGSFLVVWILVGSGVLGLVLAVEVVMGVVKGLVDLWLTVEVGGTVVGCTVVEAIGQHGKGGSGEGGQHTVVSGVDVMKGGC